MITVSQVQLLVRSKVPLLYPKLLALTFDPNGGQCAMLDERGVSLLVPLLDSTSRDITLIRTRGLVLPYDPSAEFEDVVVNPPSSFEDSTWIDIRAVSQVDRLVELDLSAFFKGWHRHTHYVIMAASSAYSPRAVLGRQSDLASRIAGRILLNNVDLTPEAILTSAENAVSDGEWLLLAPAMAQAVLSLGMDSVFDEGERIEITLASDCMRALTVGLIHLFAKEVGEDPNMSLARLLIGQL
jgi:hypothetical protein